MVKILEKSTMEPWYRTDESRQQIGKKEVQTLVYDTLNTTMIHIEKDKKRPALYRCSSGMVFRPATHDGYTGNRNLRYYSHLTARRRRQTIACEKQPSNLRSISDVLYTYCAM